ncbi:MAG: hypothetical protein Q9160_005896 [Pyrenula sp. 1 TL-2023]
MPQLSRRHDKRDIPLSDYDVELLYDIVNRAEARSAITKRPLAALWNIYDSTPAISEHGDDLDKRFFDFLVNFSLPEYRGRPLLETFRTLLRAQDIILKDTEGPQAQEEQKLPPHYDGHEGSLVEAEDEWRRPTRRVSFTSLYDTTKEIERQLDPRPPSRASVSKLDIDRFTLPQPNQSRKWTRRQLKDPGSLLGATADSFTDDQQDPWNLQASSNRPRTSALNNRRYGHRRTLASNSPSETLSYDSSTAISAASQGSDPSCIPNYPPELLYRPTKTKLVRYADVFIAHREAATRRLVLDKWNRKAIDIIGERYYWESRAAEIDRKALLGQALSAWRTIHRERARLAKVERFYDHLSSRADFARDLYLMGRAFSHWLVSAANRVAETHVARRHLLRLKYFNAWHEITVAQELKAQRLGMKRAFNPLIRRYALLLDTQAHALTIYHRNLTKVVFYRWFHTLCEKNAPKYRDRHLKKDALLYWIQKLRAHREYEVNASTKYQRRVIVKVFSIWAQKTRIDLGGNHQADGFNRDHLTRGVLEKWHLEARLNPIANQVNRMQDWRVARTFFNTWLQRARPIIRADNVNELRVQQNAWTAWNDRLRIHTVQLQINARIRMQALYQWVLAERAILMRRSYDRRIMKNTLQQALSHFRERKNAWNQQEALATMKRRQVVQRSLLSRWEAFLDQQRHRESVATETYRHRVQQKYIQRMRDSLADVRYLRAKAQHGRFYFLTMRIIRRWRSATVDSQKKRRQDAYARMRRLIKVNMASRSFAAWSQQLRRVQSLDQIALPLQQTRSTDVLLQHFRAWRSRELLISQMYEHGAQKSDSELQTRYLRSWREKAKRYSRLEDQAAQFQRAHTTIVCSVLLRRISLRALMIHQRDANADATADAIRDRHWNRHLHSIFRHWADRAAMAVLQDDSPTAGRARNLAPDPESEIYASRLFDTQPSDTRRIEDLTAFDEFSRLGDSFPLLPSALHTVTPRYLSTPSKRAARARALANLSTTPGTPTRTPFAARIRAEALEARELQTPPPKAKATREGVGKSNLGQHVSSSDDTTQE